MKRGKQQDYQALIEELRHRYRLRYGTVLDDEILYLFVRINELQVDLKNEVQSIKQPAFAKGAHYLLYGLGKSIGFLMAGLGMLAIAGSIYRSPDSSREKKYDYIQTAHGAILYLEAFAGSDTIIEVQLPIQKKKSQ